MSQPLKLFLGSIFLFVVALASYLLGMQRFGEKPVVVPSPTKTAVQVLSPTPMVPWHTLKSTFGYTISYPSSYKARATGMVDDPLTSPGVALVQSDTNPLFVSISVFDNKNNIYKADETLEEVAMLDFNAIVGNKSIYIATVNSPKKMTFAHLPAYTYTLISKGSGGADGGWSDDTARTWHTIEVLNNNNFYRFIYPDGPSLQKIIDTVTFQ